MWKFDTFGKFLFSVPLKHLSLLYPQVMKYLNYNAFHTLIVQLLN